MQYRTVSSSFLESLRMLTQAQDTRVHEGARQDEVLLSLTALPGYVELTKDPCSFSFDNDPEEWRARMCCGHVISVEMMIQYCRTKLEAGHTSFSCSLCKANWSYKAVHHVVSNHLSQSELMKLYEQLNENGLRTEAEIMSCPLCKTLCQRTDFDQPYNASPRNRITCKICERNVKKHENLISIEKKLISAGKRSADFCWCCGKTWISLSSFDFCGNEGCDGMSENQRKTRELALCGTKKISDVSDCPDLRACVQCSTLIHHYEACKHMTCTKCDCNFCFVCLKEKLSGQWQCGGALDVCLVAPRQVFGDSYRQHSKNQVYHPQPEMMTNATRNDGADTQPREEQPRRCGHANIISLAREQSIVSTTAVVMPYDETSRRWTQSGTSPGNGVAPDVAVHAQRQNIAQFQRPDIQQRGSDIQQHQLQQRPKIQQQLQPQLQQRSNLQQQRPDIHQQRIDIQQKGVDIQYRRPDIQQQRPNISQQRPDIQQQRPDIQQQQRQDTRHQKPKIQPTLTDHEMDGPTGPVKIHKLKEPNLEGPAVPNIKQQRVTEFAESAAVPYAVKSTTIPTRNNGTSDSAPLGFKPDLAFELNNIKLKKVAKVQLDCTTTQSETSKSSNGAKVNGVKVNVTTALRNGRAPPALPVKSYDLSEMNRRLAEQRNKADRTCPSSGTSTQQQEPTPQQQQQQQRHLQQTREQPQQQELNRDEISAQENRPIAEVATSTTSKTTGTMVSPATNGHDRPRQQSTIKIEELKEEILTVMRAEIHQAKREIIQGLSKS